MRAQRLTLRDHSVFHAHHAVGEIQYAVVVRHYYHSALLLVGQ
jgi:ERCC4-related helicase